MPTKKETNDIVVKAVGHPIRREILRLLDGNTNGGLSPKLLADKLDKPIGDVSYHVRTLAKTGVLKLSKTQPRRGAVEHFYKRAGNHADRKVAELLKTIGKD